MTQRQGQEVFSDFVQSFLRVGGRDASGVAFPFPSPGSRMISYGFSLAHIPCFVSGAGCPPSNRPPPSVRFRTGGDLVSSVLSSMISAQSTNVDTVSGATRTSDAIKKAALEAIQSAPVAGETVTIDTAKLESAIAAAEKLTESDYTADSWSAMQTKLTVAKAL